jgi:hypothetical protein
MRFNPTYQYSTLLPVHNIKHFLNNVIRELVLHHNHECARAVSLDLDNLLDQNGTRLATPMRNAFLNNVTRKLVFTHLKHLSTDFGDDHGLVDGATALEDVLDHIVAVLVLDKINGEFVELLEEGLALNVCAMLKDSLYNSTAIRVRGQGKDLGIKSRKQTCPLNESIIN